MFPIQTNILRLSFQTRRTHARHVNNYKMRVKTKCSLSPNFAPSCAVLKISLWPTFFRGEHNNHKFGFKYNKCLKFFKEGLSRIQGNFVQDRLEGLVKVDFLQGGYMMGRAKNSRFVGIVRHFDDNHKLLNLTFYDPKSKEEIVISKNHLGYFKVSTTTTRKENRILYSKDFKSIISCELDEPGVMKHCFETDKLTLKVEGCNINVDDLNVKVPQDFDGGFKWNLQNDEKHKATDEPYAKWASEWTADNVAANLKKWLLEMNDHTKNPFWTETFDDMPALKEDQTEVTIKVPEQIGRHLVNNKGVPINATTFDQSEVLGEVTYDNGVYSIEPYPSDSWKSTLRIPLTFEQIKISNENFFGVIGKVRNGKMHGNVRRFGQFVTVMDRFCLNKIFAGLGYVGRFEQGVPVGPQWRVVVGFGVIYGHVDEHGEMTGDNIAFIYPDMRTAIMGKFEKGKLISGKEVEVVAMRNVDGIMEVAFTQPTGPDYHYDLPTKK